MYALTLLLALTTQRPDSLAAAVREYVTVDTSLLALTHVLLVDGTGAAPKSDQTVVIRAGRISAVGPAASVPIPAGARVMDMSGSTVTYSRTAAASESGRCVVSASNRVSAYMKDPR